MLTKTNNLIKLMNKFIKNKQIISIYDDPNEMDTFYCGIITKSDNESILLKSIANDGSDSGFHLILIKDIYSVSYNGQYENNLKILYENQGKIFKESTINTEYSESLIKSVLEASLKKETIITLWLIEDSDIVGIVEDINSTSVILNIINEFGKKDGSQIVEISSINRISYNSKNNQILKFFLESK